MKIQVMSQPKYALLEIERRWLVREPVHDLVDGVLGRDIEDRYLPGTRLRLRKVTSHDGTVEWKFCKKYGTDGQFAEPITNIYLSESEYATLAQLPARVVLKKRYVVAHGAIDVYSQPAGVIIFEAEFQSSAEASSFEPPSFVAKEVTGERQYSGAALAGVVSGHVHVKPHTVTFSPPSLRGAQAQDAAFIYRVIEQTMRGHVEATWGAWVPERVHRESADDSRDPNTRIIQFEGRDCGVFHVESAEGALWVRMLFVLEEFQSRGIGRYLLNQAQAQAESHGVPVRLRVMKVNPAWAYYERNGFRVYKEADEFFYMER